MTRTDTKDESYKNPFSFPPFLDSIVREIELKSFDGVYSILDDHKMSSLFWMVTRCRVYCGWSQDVGFIVDGTFFFFSAAA